jgi:hypothetical protein
VDDFSAELLGHHAETVLRFDNGTNRSCKLQFSFEPALQVALVFFGQRQ